MEHQHSEPDIEHFNQWAEKYEQSGIQRYIAQIHEAMVEQVSGEVPSPDYVLDIGCGTGRLLRQVAQQWPGARLVGVDPAEGMIAVAQHLVPDAEFLVAPAELLPVPSGSFDVVFSTISMHHWANQAQGLQEIGRVLRPGGVLCLADVTMPRWVSRMLRSKAQSAKMMRRLVTHAGLELIGQRRILAHVILIVTARKTRTTA